MKTKDIAKNGLKGRRRDTFLLKLVVTLAFIFIITAMIFQSSSKQTKLAHRLDLYGEWEAVYLYSDNDILEGLAQEPSVKELSNSMIIGNSGRSGVVGTYNEELIDMGNLTLFKGNYPEADNEIMVELNQMSALGLEPEIGQKISIEIDITLVSEDVNKYIDETVQKINENGKDNQIEINKNGYNSAPFETINDILVVVSSEYMYVYNKREVSESKDVNTNLETILTKGLLVSQKVILKKDFVISGILNTYTDKWDLGGYYAPNTFITETASVEILDAFYKNSILPTSDYEFKYNVFLT